MDYDLAIIIVSLLFSALFSGVEIAFVSSNRLKIELDKSDDSTSTKIVGYFYKKEGTFLSVLSLGSNLSLVIFGVLLASAVRPWLQYTLRIENEIFILLAQMLLATVIALIVVEFTPKMLFRINPNKSLTTLAVPVFILYSILYIPTICLLFIGSVFFKSLRFKNLNGEKEFSKADLEHYVNDLTQRINEEEDMGKEVQILHNALDFDKVKARDCMIPRPEIISIEADEPIDNLRRLFVETGISKIIVYKENIDNIIGYVHSYELFKKPSRINTILRPIQFVPEAAPGKELLQLFTKQSANIAVVVDEYGGTAGIVTIEDVMEEIFGEIEDEHDKEDWLEEKIGENEYRFSARADIDYLNEHYHLNLPESEEYDTLGGLIIHHLENIPPAGTELDVEDFKFLIEAVTDRRIEIVRIQQN